MFRFGMAKGAAYRRTFFRRSEFLKERCAQQGFALNVAGSSFLAPQQREDIPPPLPPQGGATPKPPRRGVQGRAAPCKARYMQRKLVPRPLQRSPVRLLVSFANSRQSGAYKANSAPYIVPSNEKGLIW